MEPIELQALSTAPDDDSAPTTTDEVVETAEGVPPAEEVALTGQPEPTAPASSEEAELPPPDVPSETATEAPVGEVSASELEIELEYSPEELLGPQVENSEDLHPGDTRTKAMLEALVYITEEPLTVDQIAAALEEPKERVRRLLEELIDSYSRPEHGLTIREVAGGFKMGTKPEHHEAIRQFVRNLKPPLKLSLAALETLAVIAYKQPITSPEIMEIRGVQGTSVLKTLLDRKLIATAGRKNVIGKPMLYKTTRDFLVQFGLKDLSELPTLKEFEELRRLAIIDEPVLGLESAASGESQATEGMQPFEPQPEANAEEAEAPPPAEPQPEAESSQEVTTEASAGPEPAGE